MDNILLMNKTNSTISSYEYVLTNMFEFYIYIYIGVQAQLIMTFETVGLKKTDSFTNLNFHILNHQILLPYFSLYFFLFLCNWSVFFLLYFTHSGKSKSYVCLI